MQPDPVRSPSSIPTPNLDRQHHARIVEMLGRFPEIEWDRLGRWDNQLRVYGWLARPDGKRDFLVLGFTLYPFGDIGTEVVTSSAKYSFEFYARATDPDWAEKHHVTCERVADVFPEAGRG